MAELQSAYELTCSLREYNEQLAQARPAALRTACCGAERAAARACANPTPRLARRADAPLAPPQVRELLAAEPGTEEYTDLQTSLLEARRLSSRAACRALRSDCAPRCL